MPNKAFLIILDGWGIGKNHEADAIYQASTPHFDHLMKTYPHSKLKTFGLDVGLPEGQMGNSEVGHLNIGAGRIVHQDLVKINLAIEDHSLFRNPTYLDAIQQAKTGNKKIHLLGLVSDGGVHSHINHLLGIQKDLSQYEDLQVYTHAFMDGRDTDPEAGINYLGEIMDQIKDYHNVHLASVIGRYYAMDRDKRWERIKLAYDLLVNQEGTPTTNFIQSLKDSYKAGVTDEFLKPLYDSNLKGKAKIQDGDVVLFFNFRTDRPRQITTALTQKAFEDYAMKPLDLKYYTMTRYDESFQGINVLFEKDNLKDTLGEVLSNAGKTQTRIAETEKYPHVTFFFNGGREEPFPNESRILVNSPKVATYDLQPEMSAFEVAEKINEDIEKHAPDFICLNYANADMVGHTGDFEAAKKAAQTVDTCLESNIKTAQAKGYDIIIIADHGNSDYMINPDGSPNTAHTTNLVPCIFVSDKANLKLQDGILADIAPTILKLMEIKQPETMTGKPLL